MNTLAHSHILFSVIVPAYNAEKYLDACVGSILGQTYPDFELILVDDGSVDGTGEMIDRYAAADPRVRAFHKENGGHTSARNYGLRQSVGQYIVFVDADDMIEPEVLSECQVQIALHAPDVVVYGLRAIDGNPDLFKSGIGDGFYRLADTDARVLERILMSPTGNWVFPKSLSGKAFLREKLLSHQLAVPEDVRVGEDGACFVRVCLDSESIAVISSVNYLCTVHAGSISRSSDKYALRRCLSLFRYYEIAIREKGENAREQLRRYVIHHLFASLQFVAASDAGSKYLKAEFKAARKDAIVQDAIRHAKFDKKAKKMRRKHTVIKHGMLGVIRLLIRKKSNIA